jgi:hypothetical protein
MVGLAGYVSVKTIAKRELVSSVNAPSGDWRKRKKALKKKNI